MSHRLTLERYCSTIVDETATLVAAVRDRLDADVPSCPEWDAGELVEHLREVQEFWRLIVEQRLQDPTGLERGEHPARDEVADALLEESRRFVDVLAQAEPDDEVYTWTSEQTVGWVARRQAHEAAVHRVDAQLAAGSAEPITTELAVDGIDEWFEFFVQADLGQGVIRLQADDADVAWHADSGGNRVEADTHDVIVRASASDLLLALWQRRDIVDLVAGGDGALAADLVATADLS